MVEPLAARVTARVPIPTIGIGASPECGGQIEAAVKAYAEEVRDRLFRAKRKSIGSPQQHGSQIDGNLQSINPEVQK